MYPSYSINLTRDSFSLPLSLSVSIDTLTARASLAAELLTATVRAFLRASSSSPRHRVYVSYEDKSSYIESKGEKKRVSQCHHIVAGNDAPARGKMNREIVYKCYLGIVCAVIFSLFAVVSLPPSESFFVWTFLWWNELAHEERSCGIAKNSSSEKIKKSSSSLMIYDSTLSSCRHQEKHIIVVSSKERENFQSVLSVNHRRKWAKAKKKETLVSNSSRLTQWK